MPASFLLICSRTYLKVFVFLFMLMMTQTNGNKQLVVTPAKGGKPFEVVVNHTFNEEQIEWFKYGSALNRMKTLGAKK